MCESLLKKMAVEEQEAMEECRMAAKQRVRLAHMEEGQKGEKEEELGRWSNEQAEVSETKTERLMEQVTAAEEDRPGRERDEKCEEEKQETAEERGQMDEEAVAADQEEFHRDRDRDCMEKEEDGQFRWEELEWESTCTDFGASNLCLTCGVPGFELSQGVEDSARHAVRLSRGRVMSQTREQAGQDGI